MQLAEGALKEGSQEVEAQWSGEEDLAGVAVHASDVALAYTVAVALGAYLAVSDDSWDTQEVPSYPDRMGGQGSYAEGGQLEVFAGDAYDLE